MASWSTKRKFTYGGVFVVVVAAAIFVLIFSFFYKRPTCTDGIKNGNEQGIDCGGSCVNLCQTAFLSPRVVWGGAKFEKVAEGLYNVAVYIENKNIDAAAVNVPYKITLFDTQGNYVAEKEGYFDIPPHRNTMIFDGVINVGQRIPAKATFEFLRAPVWFKSHDTLGALSIGRKDYTEDGKNSSLEVALKNNSLVPYQNVRVGAILYDKNENVIGFSRTFIDTIAPGREEIAPFTWPVSREGRVTTIEVLPTVQAPHDR